MFSARSTGNGYCLLPKGKDVQKYWIDFDSETSGLKLFCKIN